MCTSDEKKRLAYNKAIEGYQFQVDRYNIWMNYYAIFVGALFIAFYTIWPSDSSSCCCCKCCKPESGHDVWFLLLVISILGFFASVCWYGALLGYRKWNGHWMKIVRECENSLNKSEKDLHPVYDEMPERSSKRCILKRIFNAIKKLFSRKNATCYYVEGYISTQKITGIFIICIMLAWIASFAFAIYKLYDDCCCVSSCVFGIGVVVMIVLLCCLHYGHCCLFSSEIIKKE